MNINIAGLVYLNCDYPWCLVGEDCNTCYISNQHIGNETALKFKWTASFTCMTFESTEMSYFPNQVFKEFPTVFRLTLISNGLSVWKRSYLEGAVNLKELFIYNNPISQFEDDAFDEAPNLRIVSINGTTTNRMINETIDGTTEGRFYEFERIPAPPAPKRQKDQKSLKRVWTNSELLKYRKLNENEGIAKEMSLKFKTSVNRGLYEILSRKSSEELQLERLQKDHDMLTKYIFTFTEYKATVSPAA